MEGIALRTKGCLCGALLVVACSLLVAPTLAEDGEAPSFDTVYLSQHVSELGQMPPCTPLLMANEVAKSGKRSLEHVWNRWAPFTLSSKEYERAQPHERWEDCLAAAEEFAGRYDEEHVAALGEGQLVVGMPAEFALMFLGLPDNAVEQRRAVHTRTGMAQGTMTENNTGRWEVDEVSGYRHEKKLDKLSFYAWDRAGISKDESGAVERLVIEGVTVRELYVEETSRGGVSLTARDPVGPVRETADYDFYEFSLATRNLANGEYEAAIATFRSLAEAGHAPSQYALGDLYYRGEGVERDLDMAASWIGRAAEAGLPGALYHFGYMQLRGDGVDADPVGGYVSMLLASELGNPDAIRVIPKIEGALSPEQIDAAREQLASKDFDVPSLIHSVEPEYPELARVARLEAQVIMEALIDTNGRVTVVSVPRSTRPKMGFEEAAIAAVTEWRYEPARRRSDGEPVAVYVTIFTDFKLH